MSCPSEPAVCDGSAPPTCCQPALTAESYGQDWRVRAIAEALAARRPKHCSACGSGEIIPVFWPDASLDVVRCTRCGAVLSGRGD